MKDDNYHTHRHLVIGLLHLAGAICCTVFSVIQSVPLQMGYTAVTNGGSINYLNQTSDQIEWRHVGVINLKWMSTVLFYISSFCHLLKAGLGYHANNPYQRFYEKSIIPRRINPLRWSEYAVTHACIMSFILTRLTGNANITAWILYGGCHLATVIFGYLGEKNKKWIYFQCAMLFVSLCFSHDLVLVFQAIPPLDTLVIILIIFTYAFYVSYGVVAFQELRRARAQKVMEKSLSPVINDYYLTEIKYDLISFVKISLMGSITLIVLKK